MPFRQKESGSGSHVLIVGMTAHSMQGDKDKCLDSGMDDYLSKPVKAYEIRPMLKKHLQPKD